MARKKPTGKEEFVFFDVLYEDGTQTSNRKIPASVVGGLDGDAPAQDVLEAQDQDIAGKSGRSRGPIKSITRSRTK